MAFQALKSTTKYVPSLGAYPVCNGSHGCKKSTNNLLFAVSRHLMFLKGMRRVKVSMVVLDNEVRFIFSNLNTCNVGMLAHWEGSSQPGRRRKLERLMNRYFSAAHFTIDENSQSEHQAIAVYIRGECGQCAVEHRSRAYNSHHYDTSDTSEEEV